MAKYIITESQYQKILETGAANAAMDLDIYVQQIDRDTSHGNENVIDSIENINDKLKELKFMFSSGKKIPLELKNTIFKLNDDVKRIYTQITERV